MSTVTRTLPEQKSSLRSLALDLVAPSPTQRGREGSSPAGADSPGQSHTPSTPYPSNCLNFLRTLEGRHNDEDEEEAVPGLTCLDILVVGAGLGGLATAVALARKGHRVTVLEQATQLSEVGAGIQIPPNSSKLLRRWGVMGIMSEKAVRPDGISFMRWQDGQKIGFTDLSERFIELCGAPYYVAHRAHLHSALYERALALGVEVRLNSRVIRYDRSSPAATVVGGHTFGADLIVAADGVKSVARNLVHSGEGQGPKYTGFAVYRATVDVEKMRRIPEISWLLEKPGLHVWLTKVIDLIDSTIKWPLMAGEPLQNWVADSSRLVILGDAAHPMLPYMSQGAAMAVEDGAALAAAISSINSCSQLGTALEVFQRERKQRTSMMQEASLVNAFLWHFKDGPEQRARDAAMRPEVEGKSFTSSPNQWSDPVTQTWAYGYDAESVMLERWRCEAATETAA